MQLAALSAWHLVNIAAAHGLSSQSTHELSLETGEELIELIVAAVQSKTESLPAK